MQTFPSIPSQDLPSRVMTGLAKVGLVLRHEARRDAAERGLSPLQAQTLSVVRNAPEGIRLSRLAEILGVADPTASDAVAALVRKGLLRKGPDPQDARAIALTLTASGRRQADRTAAWPDFLLGAVATLSGPEQEVFLAGLTKMIRFLQEEGRIPVSRMCAACRFFRPHAHDDSARPHHCAFVDAAFGERELRLDCPDFAPLS